MKQAATMEAAVDEVHWVGTIILARRDVTLADGGPGIILTSEGFAGQARMVISILNGNAIHVTGYGDPEDFELIALTLQTT